MRPDPLDLSILSTLAYAAVFSAGVPEKFFYSWLITNKRYSTTRIRGRLALLQKRKVITLASEILAVDPSLFDRSKKSLLTSQEKYHLAQKRLRYLTWCPFVVGVGITGSVAAFNAMPHDDIDILIVTRANCVWITRLCIVIPLWFRGFLRTHTGRHIDNKFCLNVWLDENNLLFTNRSLYIAREIIQIQWLYEQGMVSEAIVRKNPWISDFFGNWSYAKNSIQRKNVLFPHIYRIIAAADFLAFIIQKFYMGHPLGKEVVQRKKALFHPRPIQDTILVRYRKNLQRYKKLYSRHMKNT